MKRVSQLYKQGATASCIGEGDRRWWRWVKNGVSRVELGEEGEGACAVAIGLTTDSFCRYRPIMCTVM